MNIVLGLRTLALLAIVALATVVLVQPHLVGAGAAPDPALNFVPALGRN